jgi:hypothetical protein
VSEGTGVPGDPAARAEEERERPFYVVGLVLGPYLPKSELTLQPWGVRLFPVDPARVRELPKQRGVLGTMSELQFFHVRATYTQVDAPWVLVIPRIARNAQDAQRSAETDVLPPLLAALHSLAGTPYRIEILRIEDPTDPDVAKWTPMTPVGKGGPVWVDPLTSRRRETLMRRLKHVHLNSTSTAAGEHLRFGVLLADDPGPLEAVGQAALLRFYLCIERISQEVTSKSRRRLRRDLDKDRYRIADELVAALPTLKAAAAVTSIEQAGRDLRRAELGYADLEIREAGRVLGIDQMTIDDAAAFAAFRSRHLGHSSIPPIVDLAWWLEGPYNRAFKLAATYFGSYLDSLGHDQ